MRNFHLGDGQNEKSADKILINTQQFLSKTMDPYEEYRDERTFRSELSLIHGKTTEMSQEILRDFSGGELNRRSVTPIRADPAENYRGAASGSSTNHGGLSSYYDNNNNQVIPYQNFTLLIKSCGEVHRLLIVANNPDGNCLFRAISQALHSNENHHNEIRCRVVEFIASAEKWSEFYPHIKGQYENLTRKLRNRNNGLWSSVKKHRPKFLSSSVEKEPTKEDKETSSGGSCSSTTNNSPASKSEDTLAWSEESEDFKALYSRYMTVDKCYGSLQELLAAADMYSFNVVIVRELSEGYYNILNFLEKGHPKTFYFLFTGLADDGHFELLLPQRSILRDEHEINNNISGSSNSRPGSGISIYLKSGDYQQVGYNQNENWALIAEVDEKQGKVLLESQSRKQKPLCTAKDEKPESSKPDGECRVRDASSPSSHNSETNTAIFAHDRTKSQTSHSSKTEVKKVLTKYVNPSTSTVLLVDGSGDVNNDEDERFFLERQNVNYYSPLSRRRRWKHFFSTPLRILRNILLCLCCPYLFTKGILTRNPSASGVADE